MGKVLLLLIITATSFGLRGQKQAIIEATRKIDKKIPGLEHAEKTYTISDHEQVILTAYWHKGDIVKIKAAYGLLRSRYWRTFYLKNGSLILVSELKEWKNETPAWEEAKARDLAEQTYDQQSAEPIFTKDFYYFRNDTLFDPVDTEKSRALKAELFKFKEIFESP